MKQIFCFLFYFNFLFASEKADIIVFSYNRPMQLYATLESISKYVKNYENVLILYRSTRSNFQRNYEIVKTSYPQFHFIRQKRAFNKELKKLYFSKLMQNANYIIFSTDDLLVKDYIDIEEDIYNYQKYNLYGIYYRLGKHITYCYMNDESHRLPHFEAIDNLLKWKFKTSNGDFCYPNSLDFTLYHKRHVNNIINKAYKNPNELEGLWAASANLFKDGGCYPTSKIINIPLNIVSEVNYNNRETGFFSIYELNDLFTKGYKIDIEKFHKIINTSAHSPIKPVFIKRKP